MKRKHRRILKDMYYLKGKGSITEEDVIDFLLEHDKLIYIEPSMGEVDIEGLKVRSIAGKRWVVSLKEAKDGVTS